MQVPAAGMENKIKYGRSKSQHDLNPRISKIESQLTHVIQRDLREKSSAKHCVLLSMT